MSISSNNSIADIALKFQMWVSDIKYDDWAFKIGNKNGSLYLQVQFPAYDTAIGKYSKQHGRKWQLSEHMTKSEVIQTALKAVLTAEEHEIRERFLYKGIAVFGPHFDVDELLKLAITEKKDSRLKIQD